MKQLRFPLTLAVLLLPRGLQAQAQVPLPPSAQAAFDQGMDAVKRQLWPLATTYFYEAQRTAPGNPSILLNLGLAHTRAGNELPAIAWLECYLAAAPDASNVSLVRQQIANLRQSTYKKIDVVLNAAQEAENKLKRSAYIDSDVKSYQERLGDAVLEKDPSAVAPKQMDNARQHYVETLISLNLYARAREEIKRISDATIRDSAWDKLYDEFRRNLKYDEATTVVNELTNPNLKIQRQRGNDFDRLDKAVIDNVKAGKFSIGEVEAVLTAGRQLNNQGALRSFLGLIAESLASQGNFNEARSVAERQAASEDRMESLITIALRQLEAGDRAGAAATAQQALATPRPPGNDYHAKSYAARAAVAAALTGDFRTATQLGLPQDSPFCCALLLAYVGGERFIPFYYSYLDGFYSGYPDTATASIAFVQAMYGKFGDAKKTAERLQNWKGGMSSSLGWPEIAYAYLLQRQFGKALEQAKDLPENGEVLFFMKANLLGKIFDTQRKSGDLKGAEKTISYFVPPARFKEAWISGLRYPVEAYILLAEDYRSRGDGANAARCLAAAQKTVLDARVNDDLIKLSGHEPLVPLYDLLRRVADALESNGDPSTARSLRALVPATSPYLQSWLSLANSMTNDLFTKDIAQAIDEQTKRANRASEIPGEIAFIAFEMDSTLLKLRALETQPH